MEIKYLDEACVYNDGVECKDHDPERCKRCGWAPDVAERRKARLLDKTEKPDCRGADAPRNDEKKGGGK